MFTLKNMWFSYLGSAAQRPSAPRGSVFEIDDLEISKTGMTAIIGPSGSGKTTLLSILAGFLTPTLEKNGAFTFDGKPVKPGGHPPQRVAFVFQSPMLLGAASALTNAVQGAVASPGVRDLPLNEAREQGHWLRLILPGRESLLAKRARLLSGGEAQRVSILRALLADPQIILGDEPTSSLDEANAKLALDALKMWSTQKKRPVVWVTHNLSQAARYAQDHVFVSGGKLRRPPPEIAQALKADDYETRLKALQRFSSELSGEIETGIGDARSATARAGGDATAADVALPASGRLFSKWIANALSTDGLGTDHAEAQNRNLMVPPTLARAMAGIEPELKHQSPWLLQRMWLGVRHYSRYSLMIILALMLLQILMASVIGTAAQRYAQERLNDPSVARLVFELFVDGQSEDEIQRQQLFPSRLNDLSQMVADEIQPGARAEDIGVAVYARRSMAQSRLRFDTDTPACDRWWAFETVALNRNDPLVGQAGLSAAYASFDQTLSQVLERAGARAAALAQGVQEAEAPAAIGLITRRVADGLVVRCNLDPNATEFTALWDTGLAHQTPIRLVAVMDELPPLYPGLPQVIVFEDEYQAALQMSDARSPDAPRIATAYFPIQGFDQAEAVLVREDYQIRDDSASAVATLRQIETVAINAPIFVTLFALFISVAVIGISMSALFEINKRVLALYIAHGMRRGAIMMAFLRHFAPAFWGAALAAPLTALLFGWLVWKTYGVSVLDLISPRDLALSYGGSVALMLAGTLMGALSVILLWLRHTKQRLKTYLQE